MIRAPAAAVMVTTTMTMMIVTTTTMAAAGVAPGARKKELGANARFATATSVTGQRATPCACRATAGAVAGAVAVAVAAAFGQSCPAVAEGLAAGVDAVAAAAEEEGGQEKVAVVAAGAAATCLEAANAGSAARTSATAQLATPCV